MKQSHNYKILQVDDAAAAGKKSDDDKLPAWKKKLQQDKLTRKVHENGKMKRYLKKIYTCVLYSYFIIYAYLRMQLCQ